MTSAENVSMSIVEEATDPNKIICEVKDHVHFLFLDALNKNILDSIPNTKSIVKIFKGKSSRIIKVELEDQGYSLEFTNKGF